MGLFSWFSRRKRHIYQFFDGSRYVRRDPIQVGRALESLCPNYPELIETLTTPETEVPPGPLRDSITSQHAEAIDKLVSATRKAFGIKELGETKGGLTDAEVIGVLCGYKVMMDAMARDAGLFQTLPQAG